MAGAEPGGGDLRRHLDAHAPVSDCPLLPGVVTLLPSGAAALDAIFEAIAAAKDQLLLEYYIFEDVRWRGQSVVDLLLQRMRDGVRVALSYDAAGSQDTDDAVFDRLRRAGAAVFEFHPFSPFRKRFNPLTLNDRDHRKLLVADDRVAIVGGVNLDAVYTNGRDAGAPANPANAFWYDVAARLEGPPVAETRALFLNSWSRQGGDPLPDILFPAPPANGLVGGHETVRIDGSAPRERRQLYFESLTAALAAARSHVLLATGYFVPSGRQFRPLMEAAERGVEIDLILAGYSDVPSATHAARALYGRLLRRGVRIHEMYDGMLHAKVATIDGTWTSIGSSNLDRRSFVYNNELDAIVFGRTTAEAVETLLREWIGHAKAVTEDAWRHRSLHERFGEMLARVWSRYM